MAVFPWMDSIISVKLNNFPYCNRIHPYFGTHHVYFIEETYLRGIEAVVSILRHFRCNYIRTYYWTCKHRIQVCKHVAGLLVIFPDYYPVRVHYILIWMCLVQEFWIEA